MKVLRRPLGTHIGFLLFYSLLAVVLTWPLVQHLGTHVPGSDTWAYDEYTFIWNSWWLKYSLFDLGQNPLYTDHIFYPVGISLVLYTFNLFNALISLPLQPFLSLPAISNLTFLLATVLSAYGAFLLADYLLADEKRSADGARDGSKSALLAAGLAGLVYGFGSYRMVYAAIGHQDMWSTAWIPLYTLFLIRTLREPRLWNAVVAGVMLVLAMLSEMIFGVFLAMLSVILLVFALGKRGRQEVAGGWPALLKRLAVLALVAGLLYLPLLVPILREMLGGYELTGWGDAEKLSVDLVGLVTPTALHPWGGDWVPIMRQVLEGTARFRDINTVFLGWAGLALATLGAVRYGRRLAAWITSFVVFCLFSLGPVLQINGRSLFDLDGLAVNVPLPFILLHYLPIVKANRVPNRFSVVLMLALAVLAAFGAYWLLKKLRGSEVLRVGGAALLAGLILFEHWSVPLPLTDARIPPVYEQVAAEPGDFAILQLPMGWRNSFGIQGSESTQTQYYQTYHQKRLLSGNISRNPPFKFDYFRHIPIVESLIAIQAYDPVDAERRAEDRATADEFVSFYDIRYVVVAPGVPGRPPYVDTRADAVAYVEEVLSVVKIYDQDDWLLYRVNQPTLLPSFEIDMGAAEARTWMAQGEGWAEAEAIQGMSANWAQAQGARVFAPTLGPQAHRLTIRTLPFEFEGATPQTVAPEINGEMLDPVTLTSGWNEYAWDVPAELLRQGLNDVRFHVARLDAPADVLPDNARVGSTGVQAPVTIEVSSGGPEGFAYITLGEGEDVVDGSLHHPGYNVAVVDAKSGKLLDARGFDTAPDGSEDNARALADYIAAVPQGRIVVVAMQGDGAARLTDHAVAALHTVGAGLDPRGQTGWKHAVIGVKGASRATALESGGAEPGDGWLRVAPDRRTLSIAVDWVLWESVGP
jgi:hypothetical protein